MSGTLFVSDLDGTLLGRDSVLSQESIGMLNEAIAKGAMFSVATARTPSTVSMLLKDVHTSLPFIVMTGAALWNKTDKSYSDVVTMTPEVAEEVLRVIRNHALPSFVYVLRDNVIHISHTGSLSELECKFIAERDESPFKQFHIPENGTSEFETLPEDVVLFYAMQPTLHVEKTFEDVIKVEGCNPIFYHDMYGADTGIMEVFSSLSSKANAMLRLKSQTEVDRVVAFGDNLNDLPMLRAADVAVAVENAVPEVKEAADIVIGSNTEDSVARYILSHC